MSDAAPPPADDLARRLKEAAAVVGRAAHDFDNVLQGVIGFTELTRQVIPPDSPAAGFLDELAKAGQRGLALTRQMHQLSRGGQAQPHPPADVAAVLEQEAARLRPDLPPRAAVRVEAAPKLPRAAVSHEPLAQAVGHLMANAAEAVPAGGEVAVTARAVTLSAADAAGYLCGPGAGPFIEVSVRDTGPGIPPELLARLFVEPFVTTKVRHRGLGLAIAYRVLHAHRAGVRLGPAPGGGTLAAVVLPAAGPSP